MSNLLRIKRSNITAVPPALANGELAYSFVEGAFNSGGDRLYIGAGTDLEGPASVLHVIGGKFFTDRLDHQGGVLTANSALVVDADKKVDEFLVDNLKLDGATLSTTSTNTNLVLAPNGNGLVSIANAWTLPRTDGSAGYILTTNGSGAASWAAPSASSFTIDGDGVSDSQLFNTGETFKISGSGAISTLVSAATGEVIVTVSVADATTTTKGVASFNTDNFTVSSGAVTAKSATLGTTSITLGTTTTTLAGLTQLDVDNIRIDGNTISSVDAVDDNVDISLNPKGTGSIAVNSSRITGLADPVDGSDAATKSYVDLRSAGLDPKDSVRAATTEPITLSNTQTIDGVALTVGDRVLVKNQVDAEDNGVYIVSNTAWTRSSDFNAGTVSAAAFFFVEQGATYADSGWVLTTDGAITVGTTELSFVQFSGAGQIIAGDGLAKTGNTLSVNVANGIEISSDNVQLAATVAGDGLTFTTGVIAVGGTTDRISVTADAVDIASTYVGQTSITTVGTIGTGTWQGNTVQTAYGGTGQTSYAAFDLLVGTSGGSLAKFTMGSAGKFLQVNAAGNALVYQDFDGGSF
jgi:hypothetical protein